MFDKSQKQSGWCWYYVGAHSSSQNPRRLLFPEDWGTDIIIMTVDVHTATNEFLHPNFRRIQNTFSQKQRAGIVYELGISLFFESKLIWMNGPFKAGRMLYQSSLLMMNERSYLQWGRKQWETRSTVATRTLSVHSMDGSHPAVMWF
jgi:hypothetical protein